MNIETLLQEFTDRFGRAADGFVRAPGRVNLIGEHTDYNDGFVLPIAIDRRTWAAWAARDDSQVTFASVQMNRQRTIDLKEKLDPIDGEWTNYPVGVAAGLVEAAGDLRGMDVLLSSDVPQGSGLSSSAALEVATAKAFVAANALEIEPMQLARICQKAEHDFAGAPAGSWIRRSR
ncbi:MAG: galactokinase [Planctomycetota bacterium]